MTDERRRQGRRDALGVFLFAILPLVLLIALFAYVVSVLTPLS